MDDIDWRDNDPSTTRPSLRADVRIITVKTRICPDLKPEILHSPRRNRKKKSVEYLDLRPARSPVMRSLRLNDSADRILTGPPSHSPSAPASDDPYYVAPNVESATQLLTPPLVS